MPQLEGKTQQTIYNYLLAASQFAKDHPDPHWGDFESDDFRHLESICWVAKDKPGKKPLYLLDYSGSIDGRWPTRAFITEWLHKILDPYIGKSDEEIRAAITGGDKNLRYLGASCRYALLDERKRRIRLFKREEKARERQEETDSTPAYEGDKKAIQNLESGKTPWQGGRGIKEWFAANRKQIHSELSERLFATLEAIVVGGPSTQNIAKERGVSLQQAREDRRDLKDEIWNPSVEYDPVSDWREDFWDFLRLGGSGDSWPFQPPTVDVPFPIRIVTPAELAAMPGMEQGIAIDKRTSVGKDVRLPDPNIMEKAKIFG